MADGIIAYKFCETLLKSCR